MPLFHPKQPFFHIERVTHSHEVLHTIMVSANLQTVVALMSKSALRDRRVSTSSVRDYAIAMVDRETLMLRIFLAPDFGLARMFPWPSET